MLIDLNEEEVITLLNGLNTAMAVKELNMRQKDISDYENILKLAIRLSKWVDLKNEYMNHIVRGSGFTFHFNNEGIAENIYADR